MTAVGIEDLQFALAVGKYDKLGAEGLDRMWVPVVEIRCKSEAVPSAGKTFGRSALVDHADLVDFAEVHCGRHVCGQNVVLCSVICVGHCGEELVQVQRG